MTRDFFRQILPYGMQRIDGVAWNFFNRKYESLGVVRFSRLTDENIERIFCKGRVRKNGDGVITDVWFYNDGTNPQNGGSWGDYFDAIKKLSKLKVKL